MSLGKIRCVFSQTALDLKLILSQIIKLSGHICCFHLLRQSATSCFYSLKVPLCGSLWKFSVWKSPCVTNLRLLKITIINTALKCSFKVWPHSDILTVLIYFFLCSSSGFLMTQWEFSIQIPQKFNGKYQTVQQSSGRAVERQRCNSEVCGQNLSICGYIEPFEPFQSLPDLWISSDCLRAGLCSLLLQSAFSWVLWAGDFPPSSSPPLTAGTQPMPGLWGNAWTRCLGHLLPLLDRWNWSLNRILWFVQKLCGLLSRFRICRLP